MSSTVFSTFPTLMSLKPTEGISHGHSPVFPNKAYFKAITQGSLAGSMVERVTLDGCRDYLSKLIYIRATRLSV